MDRIQKTELMIFAPVLSSVPFWLAMMFYTIKDLHVDESHDEQLLTLLLAHRQPGLIPVAWLAVISSVRGIVHTTDSEVHFMTNDSLELECPPVTSETYRSTNSALTQPEAPRRPVSSIVRKLDQECRTDHHY